MYVNLIIPDSASVEVQLFNFCERLTMAVVIILAQVPLGITLIYGAHFIWMMTDVKEIGIAIDIVIDKWKLIQQEAVSVLDGNVPYIIYDLAMTTAHTFEYNFCQRGLITL